MLIEVMIVEALMRLARDLAIAERLEELWLSVSTTLTPAARRAGRAPRLVLDGLDQARGQPSPRAVGRTDRRPR
jgi:hypothetical protein